jgi:nucleoside-diphosphate-sugar epimerase
MRTLVSGGAGFIESHLVRALVSDDERGILLGLEFENAVGPASATNELAARRLAL